MPAIKAFEPNSSLMQALLRWSLQQLDSLNPEQCEFSMVSGDASFRKYFRLGCGDRSWIAVFTPPDKENNQAFVAVRQRLADAGLPVPELYAWEKEQGYFLLSDLGDQLLLPLLNAESVDHYYAAAMALLQRMHQAPCQGLPAYDAQRLQDEMALFPQWFVQDLLGYRLNAGEQAMLDAVFKQLIARAEDQPQVLVHRDYHSRNIMVLEGAVSAQTGDGLGLIDFQDAVQGPISYDLVSLIRDCYVHWPAAQVKAWIEQFHGQSVLLAGRSLQDFSVDVDWMGLQRHIKVLGIFARLKLRDGKSAYLDDLPLVMHYTLSVARGYEEFAEFVAWFERCLLPLAEQQSWYKLVESQS